MIVAGIAVAAAARGDDAARPLVSFTKHRLDERFFAEGAGVGDFNNDGTPDVVAGPFWFAGPDFKERHEYYPPKPFDPHGYSDNFFAFSHDFNADGWDDILIYGFPGNAASWFENPGRAALEPKTAAAEAAAPAAWKRHVVLTQVDNESPTFADIDGDGRPEIICSVGGFFGYASIARPDPTAPWTFHRISREVAGGQFTHGLGVGDIDGDGRVDILASKGWWRQPESLATDPLWEEQPFAFAPGGAQMHVRDVDGDGLNDVITSLVAHGWGLGWWKQSRAADGTRSFAYRPIIGEKPADSPHGVAFSQIHAVDVADIDGDGLDDIVAGKRFWAHGPKGDPEPNAPAVVYWFRSTRPTPGEAEFVPHMVDDDSGVGTQVTVADATGDGLPDIVVGNKKGIFVHTQKREKTPPATRNDSQPRKPVQPAAGLPAAAAAGAMSVPEGFSVKLLAAEPDVQQPIAMCFDDRGRMWVVECYAYPHKVPAAEARDRILIFEDTDGDHVLDSRKVFAEGLNLASGIAVGFGGVWVGAAPDFLFFPDADGDDVPDGPPDFLFANDSWSQFISLQVGPDGQMVLIDWYDQAQCHQQRDAVDRGNGRIFKVVYDGAPAVKVDLGHESDAALIDLLGHDNDWFVRHARRLLQERAAAGRLGADTPRLLQEKLAAATTAPKKLRAIWALHGAGVLDGIVVQETPTSVTLQTPTERVTVSLDEIESRVLSPQSLMPENQLAQLAPDLVAYLRHPTQVPLPGEQSPSNPNTPAPGASR